MKETIKITGILTLICIICAFLLSLVWVPAQPKIEFNLKKLIEDTILNLAPQATMIEPVAGTKDTLFELKDREGKLMGYAFLAEGQGYQGTIQILATVDPTFKILGGIEIIESRETPGLGSKIKKDSFRQQFKGLNISRPIECIKIKKEEKKDNQITAITGATVSSKAVVNILNKRIEELRQQIK